MRDLETVGKVSKGEGTLKSRLQELFLKSKISFLMREVSTWHVPLQ